MPVITVHLAPPLRSTFRTEQIAGMFDLPREQLAERLAHTLTAELPEAGGDWTIGAIVGPSGSGKSTLARAAYGDALYEPRQWPEDEAMIDVLDAVAKAPTTGRGDSTGDVDRTEVDCAREHHRQFTLTTGQGFDGQGFDGHLPLKSLLHLLTAVGLASPPSWLRPYHTLSTGERFRADVARAILGTRGSGLGTEGSHSAASSQTTPLSPESPAPSPLLVLDEFTSTLDRTTACTASLAIAKYLRSNPKSEIPNPKFVVLSCHTDFLPWLSPDWILDLTQSRPLTPSGPGGGEDVVEQQNQLAPLVAHGMSDLLCPHWPRGSLQRPPLRLAVRRVKQALWPHFARHHYLTGGLAAAATCYAAFWEGAGDSGFGTERSNTSEQAPPSPQSLAPKPAQPVAFCAVLATLGWKRTKRITRLVVLPQFQGLGIAARLAEVVADHERSKGFRVTITASHPAIIAWCSRSPRWRYVGLKKTGSTRQRMGTRAIRCSTGRAVASFEYVGA